MPAEGFTYLPPHKPISLDNVTCPYCGRHFSDTTDATLERTTEHVISRRFVPKGTLNQQWNLIISAHRGCNGRKSDYEDDISAITMQPNVFGVHADDHELLAAEAIRKGKSVSRKTRRPVKDSSETISFSAIMGPAATLKGNFACAPQVDERRAAELARMQAQAFFYFLTYKPDLRVGHFWRGQFIVVNMAPRLDWGNELQRGFMDVVVGWEPRFIGIGARDFFKVAIRKHPQADSWSWALEWNKNLRLVGFFGDEAAACAMIEQLPKLPLLPVAIGPNGSICMRSDMRLADSDDKLFYPGGAEAA